MKIAVLVLAVVVVVLGILFYRNNQSSSLRIVGFSNQVVAANAEISSLKTQVTVAAEHAADLDKSIATLQSEKTQIQEQLGQTAQQVTALRKDLEAAKISLLEQEQKLATLETEKEQVLVKLGAVSNQLTSVQQALASLLKKNTATEGELADLKQRKEALELEKASLLRQLNDLDTLRAQVRKVKDELWEQRIARWKRQDQEALDKGNKGYLLQGGQWKTVGTP